MLKFQDLVTREICRRTLNNNPRIHTAEVRYKNIQGLDWSCTPRPKPLAINDSTHDLPNFNRFKCKQFIYTNTEMCANQFFFFFLIWLRLSLFSVDSNIIDWSKKGKIAASFDRDLVLWGPPSTCNRNKTTEVFKLGQIKSLAFNPSGDELALGVAEIRVIKRTDTKLQVTENELQILKFKTCTFRGSHYKFPKTEYLDEIRTIAWDPTGENIIW